MSSTPKPPVMDRTRVVADTLTGLWRVLCPECGELGRWAQFWPANRDARDHDLICPGKTAPGGLFPAPGAARQG